MGNAVGSNIFNVLFILGLSALIAPLVVHVQIIRQEVPILMGAWISASNSAWAACVSRRDCTTRNTV